MGSSLSLLLHYFLFYIFFPFYFFPYWDSFLPDFENFCFSVRFLDFFHHFIPSNTFCSMAVSILLFNQTDQLLNLTDIFFKPSHSNWFSFIMFALTLYLHYLLFLSFSEDIYYAYFKSLFCLLCLFNSLWCRLFQLFLLRMLFRCLIFLPCELTLCFLGTLSCLC